MRPCGIATAWPRPVEPRRSRANKLVQKAEVTLHVRGKDLHCESEQADLYAAIDLLADKLDRQVLRYKDKLYEKRV